jgi:hypothetical protein
VTRTYLTERVADFAKFSRAKGELPRQFMPRDLAHVYVKLDFKKEKEHENASTAEDARGFLRSVARAAIAAHMLAEPVGGLLLEVQGAILHVALPNTPNCAQDFAAKLNGILRMVFDRADGRVQGWRITADGGPTLVVAGRGVHGDDSFVSLGNSANRPAKHLYEQLELPEDRRALKRRFMAYRDPVTDRWHHVALDSLPKALTEAKAIVEAARTQSPRTEFLSALRTQQRSFTAQAVPVPPAGSAASPTADRPQTSFGWVMRCDLDGFTARVEECYDDPAKLLELAGQFHDIMDEAARFVERNGEVLAQLPWAGDNFTAAALLASKEDYERAIPRRLVELALNFQKDMAQATAKGGFKGCVYAIAGGEVHGNSNGNVYLGAAVIGNRRFLVGVGEGFGRSAQVFRDINAQPEHIVVYKPDFERLHDSYKQPFNPAVTVNGAPSSLYCAASVDSLTRSRLRLDSVPTKTVVTVSSQREQPVSGRPYSL